MNTNTTAPPSETNRATSIISAALQPQAAGQITREGWANINQALGVISIALDEGERAIQELEKIRNELGLLKGRHQALEHEKASLYEAHGNALERIKELMHSGIIASVKDDKEILLRDALKDANKMCRSFWAVVERQGWSTDWEGLRGALKQSLEKQAHTMNQVGGILSPLEGLNLASEYGLPPEDDEPADKTEGQSGASCPKCERGMVFNLESNDWHCNFCGVHYAPDYIKRLSEEKSAEQQSGNAGATAALDLTELSKELAPAPPSIANIPLAILAFLLCLLPSCVHYSKKTAAGEKTSFTAIATNATDIRAGELMIASLNQSEGVKEIAAGIGAIVKTQITGRLIGAGIDAAKSATNNAIDALDTP